jgi:hypothetical protein
VKIPCAGPNVCGLSTNFTTNMLRGETGCKTPVRLVVNTEYNSTSCGNWTATAFEYAGKCVSACDNTADECMLDGEEIPQCDPRLYTESTICYVPMPANVEVGLRNAFYGLNKDTGFRCLLTVLPQQNKSIGYQEAEGLFITDLMPEYDLPYCIGNTSIECIILWPCEDIQSIANRREEESTCGFLISRAIYSPMGVNDCKFFNGRDAVIVICWVICIFAEIKHAVYLYRNPEKQKPDYNIDVATEIIMLGVLSLVCELLFTLLFAYLVYHKFIKNKKYIAVEGQDADKTSPS